MVCAKCGIDVPELNEDGLCPDCVSAVAEVAASEPEKIEEQVDDIDTDTDATPLDEDNSEDEKTREVSLLKLGGLFTGRKFFNTLSIINLAFCVIFGMFDFFLTCFDFARSFVEFEGNEQIADLFGKFQYTYDGTASTFIVVVMVCVVIAILFLITRKGNRIVNLATVSLAAVYLCIIALTFFIGLVAEVIPYLFDYLRSGGLV